MKRTLLFLALTLFSALLFAERITFTTGDLAGSSITDRFMPVDFTMMGSSCTVSSISHAEDGFWRIKLTAAKQAGTAAYPVEYEYFVKQGSSFRMRRLNASGGGLNECTLKVVSIDWNRAELEIE